MKIGICPNNFNILTPTTSLTLTSFQLTKNLLPKFSNIMFITIILMRNLAFNMTCMETSVISWSS